jgi:exo-1,4-beta-D-glucosaminidase
LCTCCEGVFFLRPLGRGPSRILLSRAVLILCVTLFSAGAAKAQLPGKIPLRDGWRVQSSAKIHAAGEEISRRGFSCSGWYGTGVPSTVLAALVANHVYADPYFGMSLRKIPGTSYPIGKIFAYLEMPPDSPYAVSWWYRTEFDVPTSAAGKTLWLNFLGINYRANIWLNGRKVADAKQVAGAFRRYEFDVTQIALPGQRNALAVEIFAPRKNDLAISWLDWNPAPPDKDMGLWQEVFLRTSGPVALRHPIVFTNLELPLLDVAHLTVTAEVRNAASRPIHGVLRGSFEHVTFSQAVDLEREEIKTVSFSPQQYPQLNIQHPRLWWPAPLGKPELHNLVLEFEVGGKISDRQTQRFGIVEITSELTPKGHRLFRINGRPLLIRGGGWAPDMLLRYSRNRLEDELRNVKELGLNAIRLEGKLEPDEFFELADREGILVMAGWSCCDHWQQWNNWTPEDYIIAADSLADQAMRLRSHASVLAWLNGSDIPPPRDVEQVYLDVLKKSNWPKPVLSSASEKPAELTGSTGMKMPGPYDYVPPNYWLTDKQSGGAFGFNTEAGQGPAPPPLESLQQMLPANHLWPVDEVWNFHAGGGRFAQLDQFREALEARYGKPSNLEDFVWKSQAMTYEGERALLEAYARNKYESTGVIHWMLNNAWPSLIWHLYDYFLRPGGGYFGARKANEPLHVQYSYDDQSIVVVNSLPREFAGLRVSAAAFDSDLQEKFSREVAVDVAADGVVRAFALPAVDGLTTTYFLRLTLTDSAGKVVSTNFYWLSTKPDRFDMSHAEYYRTPMTAYADLTSLARLPRVVLKAKTSFVRNGREGVVKVTVSNPTPHLALLVRLRLLRGKDGPEILPVWWSDGYFELLPSESKELHGMFHVKHLGGASVPAVAVDGWNVEPIVR